MTNEFLKGIRVSIISIISNILLSGFKLIAGIIGKSNAMISDSIHSLSDVLSTFIVILGLKLSNKKEDKEHPYGHERFECIASLLLAIILFTTGILIGWNGIKIIIYQGNSNINTPTTIALIAAITSIITKEAMYWYTKKVAKSLNSGSLMADAWHHRSDALSSIGSLIGIGGSMLGYKLLDPIASIIICLCIIKVSLSIFIDAINKVIDKSCDEKFIANLNCLILKTEGVITIDSIKTRLFGNKVYVDLEIAVDGNISLNEAHQIAHNVNDLIENTHKCIKHCTVHVNPANNS